MPHEVKTRFLSEIAVRYGEPQRFPNSQSLYGICDGTVRLYIRYSKVHTERKVAFYGLRHEDIKALEGRSSVICFLWDKQTEPLLIPFSDFEDVFDSLTPASDGQFKAQVYVDDPIELYLAGAGRFNVEAFLGWEILDHHVGKSRIGEVPELGHSQIQTLIGSIGSIKGYDVWIPRNDRLKLDWSIANEFLCRGGLPKKYEGLAGVLEEVDVIWLKRGASHLSALFEVEHSTPIYSGLLRFNDLFLVGSATNTKYNIVSNDSRRSIYLTQINRPTFKQSGLREVCNFLEYRDVYTWHNRLKE